MTEPPEDEKREAVLAALAQIKALRRAVAPAPMDAARYRRITSRLPRPTPEQIDAFVAYVSDAHSWYKHLPWRRCVPFVVYLDPGAGRDRVVGADGRLSVARREVRGFHHSALATDIWRERFGHLNYAQSNATQGVTLAEGGVSRSMGDNSALIFDPADDAVLPLPPQALQIGEVRLSSLVQRWMIVEPMIIRARVTIARSNGVGIDQMADEPDPWPEEAGGRPQLLEILRRITVLLDDPDAWRPMSAEQIGGTFTPPRADSILYELLKPEHNRQQRELRAACVRACDGPNLIDEPPVAPASPRRWWMLGRRSPKKR
jgi:hypothetical protein